MAQIEISVCLLICEYSAMQQAFNGSQRYLSSDPKTCEYVTTHGKKDFVDATQLKILRWRDCCRLSFGPSVITIDITKERIQENQCQRRCKTNQGTKVKQPEVDLTSHPGFEG